MRPRRPGLRHLHPRLPSVPTFRELGIPYETGFWLGFYGPKGLPQDLANRIAADFAKTFSASEVKDAVEKAGMSVMLAGLGVASLE